MSNYHIRVNFWGEKNTRTIFIGTLTILAAGLLIAVFAASDSSAPFILKFDGIRGISMFGEYSNVLGLWLLGFFMTILNFVLGEFFFFRDRALSYIAFSTNVVLSAILFIALAVIVHIN
ncbi:hypothetical protein A3I34_01590 [Candidatus Jorgensenbacteria bacterium RIFCSPLOWO2_02_FULL_45_12]|uniref:Uncharacterized protein n=2 Tax=Candidatus Joergenseniibacteriota TaxID=1752739 RepID=A0A1F6BQW8_9BACT|nr:MAG: hypothetical protein UX22_C0014G0011 [Candidatus Jorgensenbacteria bacterium GW2011_GWA2_45_9]OGG39329.1 MAG: hypothetical protein A3D55_00585 [Candidatus Jorgensenbacteria bacterium RIFCSPHIGHO2_02_FULL_45_20]OGG42696.1 MAG: hypothetical protein A3I34_01590 [Candidatus Jorgensenbacteria bacterium RIFCSPLOWO2_02_FULL_45_12]